jgi:uncharacterized membrane protein
MKLNTFILIIALKILAIQVIAMGVYCQMRSHADMGSIFITIGSLIFAIASNTILFVFVYNTRRKKRGRIKHEPDTSKNSGDIIADINQQYNTRAEKTFA